MDGSRFDDITRALAAGASRRAVLRRLGAGLAGVGLAAAGRGAARAAPSPCAAFCADQPGARGAQCRQACRACAGGPAATCLNAATGSFACTDLLTDEANCGACGAACGAGETCQDAVCCATTVCGPTCCDAGQDACLLNQSCAETCTPTGAACPQGCGCFPSVEGPYHCIASGNPTCDDIPQVCSSTADCPPGQHCQETGCGARCLALCPTA